MDSPHIIGTTPEQTYQVMPDRITLLENEVKAVRQQQSLQLILWVVLFVLLLIGSAGFGAWQFMELRDARMERQRDVAEMQKKMDDLQAKWLSRQDEKVSQMSDRYDRLSDRLASFEDVLNWIKGRQDTIKEWYPPPVDQASK